MRQLTASYRRHPVCSVAARASITLISIANDQKGYTITFSSAKEKLGRRRGSNRICCFYTEFCSQHLIDRSNGQSYTLASPLFKRSKVSLRQRGNKGPSIVDTRTGHTLNSRKRCSHKLSLNLADFPLVSLKTFQPLELSHDGTSFVSKELSLCKHRGLTDDPKT